MSRNVVIVFKPRFVRFKTYFLNLVAVFWDSGGVGRFVFVFSLHIFKLVHIINTV